MQHSPAKMIAVLSITAITVGTLLAGFYKFAEPRIEANRLAEEKRAIFTVLPAAKNYTIIEKEIKTDKGPQTVKVFKGLDENDKVIGYAFVAAGPGFQAILKMMVGLNIDLETLVGMEVLEQLETPGLGDEITKPHFKDQFKGLKVLPEIGYVKNIEPEKDNQIKAITGATITSVALIKAINNTIPVIVEIIKEDAGLK